MLAHLYSKKYGIPLEKLREQMALVAIKSHRNGKLNPNAHFGSIRDIMDSRIVKAKQKGLPIPTWTDEMEFFYDLSVNPWIAKPLQLFNCCPFSDGAAAVVLTSLEMAKHLTDKPVIIAGVGQASAGDIGSQKDFTLMPSRQISAKQAYDMAGLGPNDIDVCELHDCFSRSEIVCTEALGFFDFGNGSEAVERGETEIGGRIAINPSGGLKARGHPIGATGAAQVYEIAKQLREEAGARQVDGAKVGMTDTMGGDISTVAHIILKRGW
jgi:acetyl-CoA C-acetyltransferase/acetyl-CoA acyltransferase